MSLTFSVIIFLLLFALVTFLIWNIFLFKHLKNSKNLSREYLEIKYQLQFYIAIFSVLIGVLTFLGYNTTKNIEENVKNEILSQTDDIIKTSKNELISTIDGLNKELYKTSSENERIKESNKIIMNNSEKTNDRFYNLYEQFISLNKELNQSQKLLSTQIETVRRAEKDVSEIKDDVEQIKKIDFLNQVYIVTNIEYLEHKSLDTIYFKNLKTISGNTLPKFSTPPSITISPYQGIQLSIKDVTNDFYTIYMWTKSEWEEKDKHIYDMIIIYK